MHWLIDPIQNHYADFSGRASREAYWMFNLFSVIIFVILLLLRAPFLVIIVGLALLVPNLAITIRRLHDIGQSGLWFFISFVPFVGSLILLYFLVQKSQPGDNQYGPYVQGTPESNFTQQPMISPNPPTSAA